MPLWRHLATSIGHKGFANSVEGKRSTCRCSRYLYLQWSGSSMRPSTCGLSPVASATSSSSDFWTSSLSYSICGVCKRHVDCSRNCSGLTSLGAGCPPSPPPRPAAPVSGLPLCRTASGRCRSDSCVSQIWIAQTETAPLLSCRWPPPNAAAPHQPAIRPLHTLRPELHRKRFRLWTCWAGALRHSVAAPANVTFHACVFVLGHAAAGDRTEQSKAKQNLPCAPRWCGRRGTAALECGLPRTRCAPPPQCAHASPASCRHATPGSRLRVRSTGISCACTSVAVDIWQRLRRSAGTVRITVKARVSAACGACTERQASTAKFRSYKGRGSGQEQSVMLKAEIHRRCCIGHYGAKAVWLVPGANFTFSKETQLWARASVMLRTKTRRRCCTRHHGGKWGAAHSRRLLKFSRERGSMQALHACCGQRCTEGVAGHHGGEGVRPVPGAVADVQLVERQDGAPPRVAGPRVARPPL